MTKLYISDCYAWPELRTVDGDRLVAVCQGGDRDNARRLVDGWNDIDSLRSVNAQLLAALRPFADVDLRTQGVHHLFAEHVLKARSAMAIAEQAQKGGAR